MSFEQALLAAVGALWVALSGGAGAVVRHLLGQLKEQAAACEIRVAKLEAKLDESADIIRRQNESQQKQLDAQAALMSSQQQMISALQSLSKGGPG